MLSLPNVSDIHIGFITIHAWGGLLAIGIICALLVARKKAKEKNASWNTIVDIAFWMIIGGLLGARLVHVLFYEPTFYVAHPLEIFSVWNGGMSSVGSMIGGILGGLGYMRYKKIDMLLYSDIIAYSMPIGWVIGRLACFVTHTHPGIHTNCLYCGFAYPDGSRFELSSLEAVWWFVIMLVFFSLPTFRKRGKYVWALILLYAPVRFLLDFLRSEDEARYLHLTPAQYVMVGLCVLGVYLYRKHYDA